MTAVSDERGTVELRELAEQAGRDLEDASALEILRWAADTFGKRFCVTSSMEDAVVAHPTRADTPVVGWDEKRRKVKISPIARWTQDDVDAYVAEHGVLTNPLLQDGYASVGCAPCTRRVLEGEDARAGRWAGRAKTECGLHG